jgi:signal transduction histidine kinase
LTVVDGVSHAARSAASRVDVTLSLDDDRLQVQLIHNGSGPGANALVQLADRVGALGGQLNVGDISIEAAIPCG